MKKNRQIILVKNKDVDIVEVKKVDVPAATGAKMNETAVAIAPLYSGERLARMMRRIIIVSTVLRTRTVRMAIPVT